MESAGLARRVQDGTLAALFPRRHRSGTTGSHKQARSGHLVAIMGESVSLDGYGKEVLMEHGVQTQSVACLLFEAETSSRATSMEASWKQELGLTETVLAWNVQDVVDRALF